MSALMKKLEVRFELLAQALRIMTGLPVIAIGLLLALMRLRRGIWRLSVVSFVTILPKRSILRAMAALRNFSLGATVSSLTIARLVRSLRTWRFISMGELFLDLRNGQVNGTMPVGLSAPEALRLLKEAVVALEGAIADYSHFGRYVEFDEGKVFAA